MDIRGRDGTGIGLLAKAIENSKSVKTQANEPTAVNAPIASVIRFVRDLRRVTDRHCSANCTPSTDRHAWVNLTETMKIWRAGSRALVRWRERRTSGKTAFTLIEMLVVIRPGWIIAFALCGLGSPTFGEDFYQQFSSLVDTNRLPQPLWAFPTLIDTNNTGIKVTNTVLDLGKLQQGGEISGVRLGMTMQGVVNCWGKPQGGWSRYLHGLITFSYSGVSLGFEGNRLETICVFPSGKFAGGLSSVSQAKEFVQVLGPPTERRMSGNNCSLVYLSPGGNLRLDFHEEELLDIYLEGTSSRAHPWNQKISKANPQDKFQFIDH